MILFSHGGSKKCLDSRIWVDSLTSICTAMAELSSLFTCRCSINCLPQVGNKSMVLLSKRNILIYPTY